MLAVLLTLSSVQAAPPTLLVTGATGRTGSLVYALAKADSRIGAVRALVMNLTTAKAVLNCSACSESEGIYLGDVTKPATLSAAFAGVDTVAIAVGSPEGVSKDEMIAIEFTGVENQVAALANGSSDVPHVVFCSSGGTTNPKPPAFEGGASLFWKLNAEAFLGGSGVGSTVVKPCGLNSKAGSKHRLVTGHDDKLPFPGQAISIARADVARVMVEAAAQRATGAPTLRSPKKWHTVGMATRLITHACLFPLPQACASICARALEASPRSTRRKYCRRRGGRGANERSLGAADHDAHK